MNQEERDAYQDELDKQLEESFVYQTAQRDAAYASLKSAAPAPIRYGDMLTWCDACGWEWYCWVKGYEQPITFLGVVMLWGIEFNLFSYNDEPESKILQHRNPLTGTETLPLDCDCELCGPCEK